MKPKAVVKRIIDMFMLFMLPVLMSEILTGQQAHEWLGTSMVLLYVFFSLGPHFDVTAYRDALEARFGYV